jgi:hypothetical protein
VRLPFERTAIRRYRGPADQERDGLRRPRQGSVQDEIVPIDPETITWNGSTKVVTKGTFSRDELPRTDSTAEKVANLPEQRRPSSGGLGGGQPWVGDDRGRRPSLRRRG